MHPALILLIDRVLRDIFVYSFVRCLPSFLDLGCICILQFLVIKKPMDAN